MKTRTMIDQSERDRRAIAKLTPWSNERQRKAETLRSMGFIVGARDPQRNTAFLGEFMVAEPIADPAMLPTESAAIGGFCVVGNDLHELVEMTFAQYCEG